MNNFDPLRSFREAYEHTLLTGEFRERIKRREQDGHFPFNTYNIYRLLFAIAPTVYEAAQIAFRRLDLGTQKFQLLLGPPGRVLRYFHVILVGAYIVIGQRGSGISTLNGLADPFARRAFSRDAEDKTETPTLLIATVYDQQLMLKIVQFAVYLREFVDYLFLGQHDQGYRCFYPLKKDTYVVLVREFFNLPVNVVGSRSIRVWTAYDAAMLADFRLDDFRGDPVNIPGPIHLRAALATTIEGDILNAEQMASIRCNIHGEFQQLKIRYAHINPIAAEEYVATLFCQELWCLLKESGEDPSGWNKRIISAVRDAHNTLSSQTEAFTDRYLDALSECVRHIH